MSNKKVSPAQFEEELRRILEEVGQEVNEKVSKVGQEVAKDTARELRSTSPKKSGKYASGWTYRKTSSSLGRDSYEVYNSKRGNITHLLENGYTLRNGKRKSGRPHISVAEERAAKMYNDKMAKELEKWRK